MVSSRGQTSIEVLLVVSFVLVVSLAVVIPYVENQNITNATFMAKLTILPFIEKSPLRVKLNSIIPEVDSATNEITLHIRTTGRWSDDVDLELNFPTAGRPSGCQQVCDAVSSLNAYSAVHLDWSHNDDVFCGNVSCAGTGGGTTPQQYVDEDIISLNPLTHTIPLSGGNPVLSSSSSALVTISLNNLVGTGYYDMSTVIVGVVCRINAPGDACSSITASSAGYSAFVSNLAALPPASIYLPSSMRLTQYGLTTADPIIPQVYGGLLAQFAPGASGQQVGSDIELLSTPISSVYSLSPSTMGLSPGLYNFIAIAHRAHFSYSASAPPVMNREELPLFQGNNIESFTFTVT